MNKVLARTFSTGPQIIENGSIHFRVWAPNAERVAVVIGDPIVSIIPLKPEPEGFFEGIVTAAGPGTLYGFRLNDDEKVYPDPSSRFQPYGPHGLSQVVDSTSFAWTDSDWRGVKLFGQIIYEMHIGTFTTEGTWRSAEKELPELANLGITLIEVMPVAEFPGEFGWGYDGVDLFAPAHVYGRPDDFRSFVNTAHQYGIGVVLDVVYNHFGPDGNYIGIFSSSFYSEDRNTDWGRAINYDGRNSKHVRQFMIDNAVYWISEFHLDGLRLDATQDIHDSSEDHILSAIVRSAHEAAGNRSILTIAENEPQNVKLVQSADQGGYGIDALWNDDFHHSAIVALTGRKEAYYTDYSGTPQEFVSSLKYGYLYQGQWYKWQKKRRGTPSLKLNSEVFVTFIQNHDQVANSLRGERIHQVTNAGQFRAMSALMILAPGTPMIFQGQEFAASSPFLYFADHAGELKEQVSRGRAEFLSQFESINTEEAQASLPDPCTRETFERSKLDFSERVEHSNVYTMYRELLSLRKNDPVFSLRGVEIDGAVLSDRAFVIRYFDPHDSDRLVLINLGIDLHLNPAPEPLLAPPQGKRWQLMWSSENPEYGGSGATAPESEGGWKLPGYSATVMKAEIELKGE